MCEPFAIHEESWEPYSGHSGSHVQLASKELVKTRACAKLKLSLGHKYHIQSIADSVHRLFF